MKTLILLRHAKSSWDDPSLPDRERPLTKRGRAAAEAMAEWLGERGLVPEHILCSPTRRTRETVERMRRALPSLPEPEIVAALYEAGPEAMVPAIAGLPKTVGVAMLVSHEPGISALAAMLAGGPVPSRCARAFQHFPTAAAAVMTLEDGGWRKFGEGAARFAEFQAPRELTRK